MEENDIIIQGSGAKILENLIPTIKTYPSKSGNEGTAYFVGKEFVVKYFERIGLEYSLFSAYSEELKSYNDNGLAYPKIYSWARIPICAKDGVFRYYILQEQVQGETLYSYSFKDIQPKCETFCSREEFNNALSDIEAHKHLYLRILEEMIISYIDKNQRLQGVSNTETFKFIESYFKRNKTAKFNNPDLHPENVIFDGEHLTHIDGSLCKRNTDMWIDYEGNFNEKRMLEASFYDIIDLFACNAYIRTYLNQYKQKVTTTKTYIEKMIEENERIMGSTMFYWVSACKELSSGVKFNEYDIAHLVGGLEKFVDHSSLQTLEKIIEK